MSEQPVISTLKMDRAEPLGNSLDSSGRRALHVRDTSAFINEPFDSVFASYPDGVTEIYIYKLSGATVATITVIYTDTSKETFSSIVKS